MAKTAKVQYIENKNLVDDFEMEEIRNNTNLRERILAGKRDAANRKGRFVEMGFIEKNLPNVSNNEMKDIESLYGKPGKEDVYYSEELELEI